MSAQPEPAARGLTGRIAATWARPAASWRSEWREGAGEPRLLAYAFGACAFLTLGEMAAEAVRPVVAIGEMREAWFAARFFAGLSFFPLALYASAALMRIVARAAGGRGGWRETRLALFWSGLASGPFAAIVLVVGAAAGLGGLAHMAAGLMWVALLAPMLAAAHGFRPARVFGVFLALAAGAFLLQAVG
ncbi:hypothetical protein [Pikeienuella sp. HZG-20]|uniref:hypothetical protein n=1 Tax=Paludibacillus litoralis TaxID=3133267 RepID=UPI0030EE363D